MISPTVLAAQRGDSAALTQIYTEHHARVLAICRRMLRDDDEAHDATQDLFMKLLSCIADFRGESTFSTWLHRVTVNFCLMRKRAGRERFRKSLLPFTLRESDDDDAGSYTVAARHVPRMRATQLDDMITREQLGRALARISPTQRRNIVQVGYFGYLCREVAEREGCTVDAVKSRLDRARAAAGAERSGELGERCRRGHLRAQWERWKTTAGGKSYRTCIVCARAAVAGLHAKRRVQKEAAQ